MRTISKGELTKILADHKEWRRSDGALGSRANLGGANLRDADLRDADLRDAYLRGANLRDADLGGANLGDAYLRGANLRDADLGDAYLRGANLGDADLGDAYLGGANLGGADLRGANLRDADLGDAYLRGANLGDADLGDAYLGGANLGGADLRDADLRDAYLGDAYLRGAKNVPAIPQASDAPAPAPQTYEEWLAQRPKNNAERAKRYRERHPEVPVVEQLDAKILAAIESGKGRLEMSRWHGDNPRNADGEACGTTHCRAGWAIHLAGKAGYALEDRFDSAIAGRMIYLASTGRAPHFYERSNEIALADIKQCVAEQTASPETT